MHNFFRPGRNGNTARSEVTHRPMVAEINRCRLRITLAPAKSGSDFQSVTSEHVLEIKIMSTTCEIALRRMLQNTFGDKSTFVQVIKQQAFI